jgi:AcrR family transcriptional regulator
MTLSREDWLVAAVEELRRGGVEAVRVEKLARTLDVTKGSFYWHFRDRAELLEAILSRWEEETDWLTAGASTAETPRARVEQFFILANMSPYPPDREIFAWARRDPVVAGRVEVVEAKRVAFFETQLRDLGAVPPHAGHLAEMLYLATLGWLERRWRSPAGGYAFEAFGERVADLVFAAAETGGDTGSAHPPDSVKTPGQSGATHIREER